MATTAAHPQDLPAQTEALHLQEKESREQCERALRAREGMSDHDKLEMDELATKLRPFCTCSLCKGILIEPWLMKDCGHLYCFRCLHSIVYERKLRKCPACGAGGSATINEDAFGAFKVVVDANNNRKVAREGSKFLYDDAADSLIRMLWPERVQEYVSADVDREQRRLEDLAARKHFEISVQGDRLANPSATNPGMAAGRRERASASTAVTGSRRCSAHLKAPPLKLQLPLIHPGVPANASHSGHMFLVLFMPLQLTLSEEMKEWGHASGLIQDATRLPALLKPYMRVPLERVTLGVRFCTPSFSCPDSSWLRRSSPASSRQCGGLLDSYLQHEVAMLPLIRLRIAMPWIQANKSWIQTEDSDPAPDVLARSTSTFGGRVQALKQVLAEALNNSDFWHDRVHAYPAAEWVRPADLAVYVDWTQRTEKTPRQFLTAELPDDADVQAHLGPREMQYSMHALKEFLLEQHFNVGVSIDLVYCLRPGVMPQTGRPQ